MLKAPSVLLDVPFLVDFTLTVAPLTGAPDLESVILPVIIVCANKRDELSRNKPVMKKNFLMLINFGTYAI